MQAVACRSLVSGALPVAPRRSITTVAARLGYFDQHLHFDGRFKGQSNGADCCPGVPAGIAEDVNQQLAGAVGHLGLIGESCVAAYPDSQSDNAADKVDVAV